MNEEILQKLKETANSLADWKQRMQSQVDAIDARTQDFHVSGGGFGGDVELKRLLEESDSLAQLRPPVYSRLIEPPESSRRLAKFCA